MTSYTCAPKGRRQEIRTKIVKQNQIFNSRTNASEDLLDKLALNIKDKSRVPRNIRRGTLSTIPKLWWNSEPPLAPHLHPQHPHIPPLDNLATTQLELERLPRLQTIKLLIIRLQAT